MLDCPQDLFIITNGTADKVRKLYNVENRTILESCDSYAAVQAGKKQSALICSYGPKQLFVTKPVAGAGELILTSGSTQFGPYTSLAKGEYLIEVLGTGFDAVEEKHVYVNYQSVEEIENPVRVEEITVLSDKISYKIIVDAPVSMVEFCMTNRAEDKTIKIKEINLYDNSPVSVFLENWW